MPRTIVELPAQQAFATAMSWSYNASRQVAPYCAEFIHGDAYYSAQELRALHPRLPGLLDDALSHQTSFSGKLLRLGLSYVLEQPALLMATPPHGMDEEQKVFEVADFINVRLHREKLHPYAEIRFHAYSMEEAGRRTPYPVGTDEVITHTGFAYLNHHFPGWRERLETGEAIGLTGAALCNQAFHGPERTAPYQPRTLTVDLA